MPSAPARAGIYPRLVLLTEQHSQVAPHARGRTQGNGEIGHQVIGRPARAGKDEYRPPSGIKGTRLRCQGGLKADPWSTKLNPERVSEIRLALKRKEKIPRVAERYGVSIGAIAAIQARNSWQWVPEPEES